METLLLYLVAAILAVGGIVLASVAFLPLAGVLVGGLMLVLIFTVITGK